VSRHEAIVSQAEAEGDEKLFILNVSDILKWYTVTGGNMSDLFAFLEQVQYESRPLVYAGLSIYSFLNKDVSSILFLSGLILAVCCFYVSKMRYSHRLKFNIK
jgi:hypothetical protein